MDLSPPSRRPVITLTTDFGLTDHFAGVVKGVILGINPEVELVDISHNVGAFDVIDGALTLAQSFAYFPAGTVHVVVVDPGVGSARRPILAATERYHFVAPDNGVLSLVYEREPGVEVRHLTADRYWLKPVSNTFHGRDVFAPVAAWLTRGVKADEFGERIDDYTKIALPKVDRRHQPGKTSISGAVVKVDRFGNLMTNLTPADLPELFSASPSPFRMVINGHEIKHLHRSFAEGHSSEPFAILGSSGFVEIGMNRWSAAEALDATRGTTVSVVIGP